MKTRIKAKEPITDAQRKRLFYLFKLARFDDDARREFVWNFTNGKTGSLKTIEFIEAMEMIRHLEGLLRTPRNAEYFELYKLRKGVIKAIFKHLEKCGINEDVQYVKGIAVRASGITSTGILEDDFNRLTKSCLTRIYNEFCRKQVVNLVKEDASFNEVCLN